MNLWIVLKFIIIFVWEIFIERIMVIDFFDLNFDLVLKEVGIIVNIIERGCVVVSFIIVYGVFIKIFFMKFFVVLF